MFKVYGLLIGVGIWAAWEVSLWLARKRQVDPQIVNRLSWWVIIGGILGARIYHVIDFWSRYYSLQPVKVFYLWEGGLGIWGAIIGGLTAASSWYLVSGIKYQISFLNLLDLLFIGVPLGQAIGRWGNYFNGELVGKNGEWLFLSESLANLGLFGLLVLVGRRRTRPGMIAALYFLGYGTIRYLMEPWRPDEVIWKINGWPVAQIMALAAMAAGIILIKKGPRFRR